MVTCYVLSTLGGVGELHSNHVKWKMIAPRLYRKQIKNIYHVKRQLDLSARTKTKYVLDHVQHIQNSREKRKK